MVQNPQPEAANLTSAVWHLRLARTGDTFTASYSADGTTWTALEALTNSAVGATPKVGLFTLGANQTASKTAAFDYFRLSTKVRRRDRAGDHGGGFRHPDRRVVHRAGDGHPHRRRRGRR